MATRLRTALRPTATWVAVSAAFAAWTLGAPASALGVVPHATPAVSAVVLNSSDATVTTSTQRRLRLELDAESTPSPARTGELDITMSDGPIDVGETHFWSFPMPASALKVTSAGSGTLNVPATRITPYGVVSLKITPVGTPKNESCNGAVADKYERVRLTGTFMFTTRSTGANKWGKVGSTRTPFTFATPNYLEWDYRPGGAANCGVGGQPRPCRAGLLWGVQTTDVEMDGAVINGVSVILGARLVNLGTPAKATREDDLSGTGPTPQLTTTPDPATPGAFSASLPVTGQGEASGSTTMTSSTSATPTSVPCGSTGQTESVSVWQQCTYANGTPPLSLAAEIFGPITLPDNTAATIISSSGATS